MAGLLGKAKGLWQRDKNPAADPPPPFSIRCLCGEPIDGYRRRESQTLTCPSCTEKIFIFPRSPLPAVPQRKRPAAKPKEDSDVKTPAPSAQRGGGAPSAHGAARQEADSHAQAAVAEDPLLTAEEIKRLRRPFWTKTKLLFFGVSLVVIAATWFQIDRSYRNKLREQLLPSGSEGLKLLTSGKFEEAADKLEIAVKALNKLGEPIPDEAAYRQGFAEALFFREAPVEPIDRQLSLAPQEPELISKQMHGKPIIIDATVSPTPEKGHVIEWHLFLDDASVRLDATGLELLQQLGIEKPTRIVFGARFDKLVREEDRSWRLTLIPNSGVLFTEGSIFAHLGADEDQRKLQKQWFDKFGPARGGK